MDYYNVCIIADFTGLSSSADIESWVEAHRDEIETDADGNIIRIEGRQVLRDENATFFRFAE